MNPIFNQERAANVAEGWGYLLQGRESLEVAEIADFGRLDQWRLHKLGRPTELNVEEEPESFEEIANIESGVTIEIADRYDDSFQLAVISANNPQYYISAYKFRVEGGRLILTRYSGRAISNGQDSTESSVNGAVISMLWLMTEELSKQELDISSSSHFHTSSGRTGYLKEQIVEAYDEFIEGFSENFVNMDREKLIIRIAR